LPTEVPNAEEKFNPSKTGPRAGNPAWQELWLDLADGRMRYLQAGSGRALILVHGLMGYSFSWRFAIPELASHATVYAIDNLGAGLSVARDGIDCSMRASAERVLQFADALGITDFDLLGTSHGGAVAMMTAALCGERQDSRLKRLVLVAPVNPWSRHGRWLAPFVGRGLGALLFRNTIERWRSLDHLWLRRLFGDGSKIPPDSLEGYRRPVRENHGFRYGQRHAIELDCRDRLLDGMKSLNAGWAAKLGESHTLDIPTLAEVSDTALTRDVAIAMGADGLPNTFVPGRNLVFLTFAAALAYRRGITHIVGGMCETDYSGYPDCRDETIKALQVALNLGMARPFELHTPLMWLDKAGTWALAHQAGGAGLVDLIREHSHTCYLGERGTRHDWGFGCGECPACQLRAKGWRQYAAR